MDLRRHVSDDHRDNSGHFSTYRRRVPAARIGQFVLHDFEPCNTLEGALLANRESSEYRGYVVNTKEWRREETSSCQNVSDDPVGPPPNATDIAIDQERSLLANDSPHFVDGTVLVSKGM